MPSIDTLLIWLDSGVCSQNPAHSFWVGGQPLPLCARDLGLFGGFLLAWALLSRIRIQSHSLYALGLLPMAIDGLNSVAAGALDHWLYPPNNWLRLATGLIAGVSLTMLVPRLGQGGSSLFQVILRSRSRRRIFSVSAIPPLIAAVLTAFVFLVNPYLALALLGSAGILSLLATANRLALPTLSRLAWTLALPELVVLAAFKHVAVLAIG